MSGHLPIEQAGLSLAPRIFSHLCLALTCTSNCITCASVFLSLAPRWVVGGMITYLGLAYILPYGFDLDRLDGLGGWVGGGWWHTLDLHTYDHTDSIWTGWMGWGVGGGGGGVMITYLGLAHIRPYGFDLDTLLGLAHIRPYGYDLDRLDGLGGGMVTYLGLAYILPIQVGWVGWLGGWGGLGGMITYLGLAYILPYRFDFSRLDGLGGGWGGW